MNITYYCRNKEMPGLQKVQGLDALHINGICKSLYLILESKTATVAKIYFENNGESLENSNFRLIYDKITVLEWNQNMIPNKKYSVRLALGMRSLKYSQETKLFIASSTHQTISHYRLRRRHHSWETYCPIQKYHTDYHNPFAMEWSNLTDGKISSNSRLVSDVKKKIEFQRIQNPTPENKFKKAKKTTLNKKKFVAKSMITSDPDMQLTEDFVNPKKNLISSQDVENNDFACFFNSSFLDFILWANSEPEQFNQQQALPLVDLNDKSSQVNDKLSFLETKQLLEDF